MKHATVGARSATATAGAFLTVAAAVNAFVGGPVAPATAASAVGAASSKVAVYHTPTPHASPDNIAVGADGDAWFTEFQAGAVVRMTAAGAMKAFKVGSYPTGIVEGPDQSVWVSAGLAIYGVTTSGNVRSIPENDLTLGSNGPNNIAWAGGDSLYAVGTNAGGHLVIDLINTTTGAVTTAVTFAKDRGPVSLAGGPLCGVWADVLPTSPSSSFKPSLEHIGAHGVTQVITLNKSDSPNGMACGPGGVLWVADGGMLLRLAHNGHGVQRYKLPVPSFSGFVSAAAVAVSSKGAVYFVGSDGALGERAASGHYSFWQLPAGMSGGIATASAEGTFAVNETKSEIAVLH